LKNKEKIIFLEEKKVNKMIRDLMGLKGVLPR
jgi:hypothetical protein